MYRIMTCARVVSFTCKTLQLCHRKRQAHQKTAKITSSSVTGPGCKFAGTSQTRTPGKTCQRVWDEIGHHIYQTAGSRGNIRESYSDKGKLTHWSHGALMYVFALASTILLCFGMAGQEEFSQNQNGWCEKTSAYACHSSSCRKWRRIRRLGFIARIS